MAISGVRGSRRKEAGFSLLEISIILIIVGLITGTFMTIIPPTMESVNRGDTERKLNQLEKYLDAYRSVYGRMPCPSDNTLPETDPNFGVEAANFGSCTGGSPAANKGPEKKVVEGGFPFKTLGLPKTFAYDGWNRRFTYAVWAKMTEPEAFTTYSYKDAACGAITVGISSGLPFTEKALYVLLSHGADGHGAYNQNGLRVASGITNADTLENCDCDSAGADTAFTRTYVVRSLMEQSATNRFDDHVRYKYRWQMQDAEQLAMSEWNGCTLGFRIDGNVANDRLGSSLLVGDVNGDGIDDIIMSGATQTYVLYGRNDRNFGSPVLAGSIAAPHGTILNKPSGITTLSNQVANMKFVNINGDGHKDLLIQYNTTNCMGGEMHIVFGGTDLWGNSSINLNTIIANKNYRMDAARCLTHIDVDINNDGINDLVFNRRNDARDTVYIVYGKAGGWPGTAGNVLHNINFPSPYTAITKDATQNYCWAFGAYMTKGDFNGDGTDDLLIANPNACGGGNNEAYVIFGNTSFPATTLNVVDDMNVADNFEGTRFTDFFGYGEHVAAGDINGDGIDDIIYQLANTSTFPWNFPPGYGAVIAIFGNSGVWPSTVDGRTITYNHPDVGHRGVALQGISNWGQSHGQDGWLRVADVNNDGFDDILFRTTGGSHKFWTVYGKSTWTSTINDFWAMQGTESMYFPATNGVRGLHDFNQNGFMDYLIGVPSSAGHGNVYSVFGKSAKEWASPFVYSTLDGTNGFSFDASNVTGQLFGTRIAVGDIDGDGIPDLVVSAPGASFTNSSSGSVYVFWGRPPSKGFDGFYALEDF